MTTETNAKIDTQKLQRAIVDGLEELGLAVRTVHPENGRMAMISATDAGESLMHAAAQRRFSAILDAMETLPAEDRDLLRASAPALRRLASALPSQHTVGREDS